MARGGRSTRSSYLFRRAQLLGPLGGSKGWTVVWAVLVGRRLLKRLATSEPEVVYAEELAPGQALVIRNGDRPVEVLGG